MKRETTYALLLIAGLTFFVFFNSLFGGFCFDDKNMIERNLLIRRLDIPRIFSTSWWWGGPRQVTDEYRPLTVLSFALNYQLCGLKPFLYHVINVLLHIAVSLVVFLLFRQVLNDFTLAITTALLFALHPIHTEPINNIVGRAELLAALFALLSLLCYWYYLHQHKWAFLPLTALGYLLAILSKESAFPLPLLFPLLDLLFIWQQPKRRRTRFVSSLLSHWQLYVLLFMVAMLFLILRINALGGLFAKLPTSFMDNVALLGRQGGEPLAYYFTVLKAFGFYLVLLLFPLRLSADYSFNQITLSTSLGDSAVLLSLLALLGLLGLAWWGWRSKNPTLVLSLGIFFIFFSLVSNLFFPIGTILGERLMYLPSIGFCLLLAYVLKLASPVFGKHAYGYSIGLLALILVGYGVRDWFRNYDWKDDYRLFSSAVKVTPNSARAHFNLGVQLKNEVKDRERAVFHFQRAYEIAPNYGAPLAEIADMLIQQKKYPEAEQLLKQVIQMEERYHPAHHNLGLVYMNTNRDELAIREFQRTIELRPTIPEPYYNIANIYKKQGNYPQALDYLNRLLSIEPNFYLAHVLKAEIFIEQKQPQQAAAVYQQLQRRFPQHPEPPYRLGALLAQLQRPQEAEVEFHEAIRRNPHWAEPYLALARLYLTQLNNPQRALTFFHKTLEINPEHPMRGSILRTIRELEQP